LTPEALPLNLRPRAEAPAAAVTPLRPWHWRRLPLAERTGSQVFAALFRDEPIATLLESPYPVPADTPATAARFSICAGKARQVKGQPQVWTPGVGEILPMLKQRLAAAAPQVPEAVAHLPFTGGWLGWLGYDLAWEVEQLPDHQPDPLPFPVAFWYEPDCFAVLDHQRQDLWLAATQSDELDQMAAELEQAAAQTVSSAEVALGPLYWRCDRTAYETAVRQAKAHIQAGDIFQANLSARFETTSPTPPWQIYQQLQRINPSPFASYWQTPWGAVVSCSPERLVQLQGQQAQTRPIAGTRPRGDSPEADRTLAETLLNHPKERAEHIMLVDLERNDLGRVCRWGSVQVDELFTIERYSHVMHLVSNVVGELAPDQDAIDLIRAMFPGGTITGCPKVRCMEIIADLEPERRSLFYGSCGYLDWRGQLDLNILIRTLLVDNPNPETGLRTVWGQVGAGIVADSDPGREWQEALQKAEAQRLALGTPGTDGASSFP
jgi:para-aminobenzoate synthetase component 1